MDRAHTAVLDMGFGLRPLAMVEKRRIFDVENGRADFEGLYEVRLWELFQHESAYYKYIWQPRRRLPFIIAPSS